MKCAGVKTSGPQRGEPCHARGGYVWRGMSYCAAHRTIAQAAPHEFTAARESMYRRLWRAEAARLAQSAQIYMFPVT